MPGCLNRNESWEPALPSPLFLTHRRHPSRLPFGALRAALTAPVVDAENLTWKRGWQAEVARLVENQ
jgi:hypothetical protein